MPETILTNARIVTRDEEFLGTILLSDGLITDVSRGVSAAGSALDLDGDYLLPGLIELHTDNLERHFAPRPGVLWHPQSAVLAHDAAVATGGITTVLDAIAIGDVRQDSLRLQFMETMVDAIETASAQGMLRAQHQLHLRCEVSFPTMVETFDRFANRDSLKLVSIMDHTPGQRQFTKLEKYNLYYQTSYGFSDQQMTEFIALQIENQQAYSETNRTAIVARCRALGVPLASHDDATAEHVADAAGDGMVIAEFPTTIEAARLSREAGMKVLMGAPNLVRGGSHSGNVSAQDLAAQGLLDVISSDYVPSSLLHGVFVLAEALRDQISLPQAVAKGSLEPAAAIGLTDRGEIAAGKRADLVRVRTAAGSVPIARETWVEGRRVA
jgi:alpha-D-ribose 1-methylphosphonate 5-triphosphate diphosphatase